ncbi:hypothetical protein [Pectobacterium wasabiae]|uniref:hypothetical protein n=1 Tax=Pectobacterium wasabiae TaxID=55208 RepID=UPI00027B0080|nr:hypothetical protein [Pectobacterium wasabiae]AOR65396.1 hypothetical protein A7983_19440 [Pectobacterium wasabiae CFBP 3304]EJS93172.1 Hypothetical protein Y17_3670 [Pectobacterium wasabiae CFBP 3304]
MNKNLAVAEVSSDEQLLDQLVQELFLEHLRRELGVQKKSIDDSNDKLFNLDRKFVAEFKNVSGLLDTISDTLGEQTRELNDAKADAQTHYRSLLNSLAQNRTDTAALQDILQQLSSKRHKEQGEQLQRIQEQLFHQSAELQAQYSVLTEQNAVLNQQQEVLQKQRFTATLAEMQEQNVTLASLTEQNKSLHRQFLTLEDEQRADFRTNSRWGKLAAGFSIANTLILISVTALFIVKYFL